MTELLSTCCFILCCAQHKTLCFTSFSFIVTKNLGSPYLVRSLIMLGACHRIFLLVQLPPLDVSLPIISLCKVGYLNDKRCGHKRMSYLPSANRLKYFMYNFNKVLFKKIHFRFLVCINFAQCDQY